MPRIDFNRGLVTVSTFVFSLSISSCNDQFSYTKIPSAAQLQYATPSASMIGKALGNDWQTVSSFDVGKQPFDSVSKSTVYLKNAGDLPATIKRIWIESTQSGNIFSVQSVCGNTIAPNHDPCAINILYTPNTVGATPGKLHAQYDDGHGNILEAVLPISAAANNLAFLKFQNTSIDVGNDTIGYPISATFNVIYNGASLGAAGLSILPAQGVVISDPTDGSFSIDRAATTCGSVIHQNCTIAVKFSPSVTGAKGAAFNLSYFNGSQVLAMQANVAGTGTTAVTLASLTASAAKFGNVVLNPRAPAELAVNLAFTGSVPADNVTISLANTSSELKINTDPSKTTCLGGSLMSGQSINGSCNLSLQYNPSVHGAMSNSIIVSYRSHGQDRPQTVIPVSGYGANPALVAVTSSTALNFGKVPAHKNSSQVFNIQNSGEVAVSSLSAATLSDSTDFKSAFDASCGTLAPGAKCNMTLSFKPTTASDPAALTSSISFSYDNGRATQSVSGLSATGIGTAPLVMEYSSPSASGSPAKAVIDFGNVMIGAPTLPAAKAASLAVYGTAQLSNASQLSVSPANLSSPFTFVGGSFPGTGQTCKAPFNPNTASSCSFSVGLVGFGSPTPDVALTQDFTLSYSGDGGSGSGTLAFQAKMTPRVPPVVNFAVAPTVFNTVSVNATNSQTFKLQNASPYFATSVKSVSLSGDSAFSITSNGCSSGLAANANCTITVQFKPTSAGTFNGTLNYTYNDQISDHLISTSFSGTGSANVTLVAADSTTVDFGSVYVGDTVASKTVRLNYYGSSSWTQTMTVPAPFKLVSTDCGAPQNCSLVFGLDTTAPGVSNSNFDMSYSPGLPVPAKIPFTLKANVQYRSPSFAISNTSFPKTLVGSSVSQLVTITNSGVGTAINLALPTLNAPFAYVAGPDTTCTAGKSLASKESCVVKISYTPSQVGASSAAFNVNYVNSATSAAGTSSASLTATGTQKIQLFAGAYQSCIINELGNVICWGRNSSGQLGQGNANAVTSAVQSMTPIHFGADAKVIKLAVGDSHVCAIVQVAGAAGKVTCWGNNENGRLGLGSSATQTMSPLDGSSNLQLVDLGTDSDTSQAEIAVDIAAGFEHTCAVLQSGKVKCWGGNTSGQLGIGSTVSIGSSASQMGNALAAAQLNGAKAVSVSAGAGHTCVVLNDGGSRCWGDNFYGQLGQGVATEKIGAASSDMAGLKNISLGNGVSASGILASPGAFTCALLSSGGVKCFGHTGFNETSSTPFWGVLGTCWARPVYNSAAIPCWSSSSATPTNSLGYYASDMGDNLPDLSLGAGSASQIAVGSNFGCALLSDKSIRCWGSNEHGQLGTGNNSNIGDAQNEMGANLKAAVTAAAGVEPISVATGYTHTCAVFNNNTVKCWGASTENATGLASKLSGDVGGTPTTTVDALPVVYDGRI